MAYRLLFTSYRHHLVEGNYDTTQSALAALSQRRQAEVLDFARFLGQRAERTVPAEAGPVTRIELRAAPADTLLRLTGLVALGGDALADSEAFYDDNGSY